MAVQKAGLWGIVAGLLMAAVGCVVGGGGDGACDPAVVAGCVCEDAVTGEACDPAVVAGCACRAPQGRGGRDASGAASLRIAPRLGSNAGRQFQEIAPWNMATLPGYRGSVGDFPGDARSPLVIMLCEVEDARCERPVLVREVAAGETDGAPLQGSFGPEVVLSGLPAGEFVFTMFQDSLSTRERGYGWDSGFVTQETAWGGVVSEGDLMLSAQEPEPRKNPAPATIRVTLQDGALVDAGAVVLGSYHERDISPKLASEQGSLVVGSSGALHYISLETGAESVVALPSGTQLCGMIQGQGDVAWLLGRDGQDARVALAFDTRARALLPGRVVFPGDGTPCRGISHRFGGEEFLWVTSAQSGRGPEQSAGEGFWMARGADLSRGRAVAVEHTAQDHEVFRFGVDDLVAHEDGLYLSVITDRGLPSEALGKFLLYRARFDGPKLAFDVLPSGQEWMVLGAPGERGVDPSGAAAQSGEVPATWAGLGVGRLGGARPVLLVGGYFGVKVFDLASLRSEGEVSGHYYGSNFTGFAANPAGDVMWAIPQSKTSYHFEFEKGAGGSRQSFNRLMALPLDLSGGQVRPHPDYLTGDLDGYAGPSSSGGAMTPSDDPGVDLGYAHYVGYQVGWAPQTAGATFGSAAFPVGHTAVVTERTLWLRGSGALSGEGPSGLGKGGDVGAFDLASRRAVLFPQEGQSFYGLWTGGVFEDPSFGYDISPRGAQTATVGMLYAR